jgi:hypothetical protein
MSWRPDSTSGAAVWDTEPMSPEDLACRDEEIRWLMAHERQSWGLINGRLKEKCDPEFYGTYAGIAAIPPAGTLANVASLSGEASLWDVPTFSPWLAKSTVAPSAWQIYASFQATTSTSPGNLTLNPRVGSIAVGASSTGGIALGADSAIALTASITTDWVVSGRLTIQSIGLPGANSKAAGSFICTAKPATTGTGAATINDIFGYTIATWDWSIANGFVLGMANTVTTITYAPTQIHWISLF